MSEEARTGRASRERPGRAHAVVAVVLGVAPFVVAAITLAVVEGSVLEVRARLTGLVLLFWPLLVLALAFAPAVGDPSARRMRRFRRGSVVAVLCLLQSGCWFLSGRGGAIGNFDPGRATASTLRSDLRHLEMLEGDHLSSAGAYTADRTALGFTPSRGIEAEIRATDAGWTARAVQRSLGFSCVIFGGVPGSPLATLVGRVPDRAGELTCDPEPPDLSPGDSGSLLRSFHSAIDQRLVNLGFR